ncbi:sensor histidine kinase [Salipaludibacillus neizhouensis]|uniref:Sensor histidine kinase n=1 Tax=Salipaludibacillus neizhouensis TaxID=885475 RepID=A0A3A9K6Q3_9BACI|nr:sensor histidine kinase [Salipaludibacillus neizhouensis]RKL67118.1 sensor histidine kinase [Salipaludibacillus neizhouensis]
MKNYVITKINNMKIRSKLILSFIIVVFVPVLITGLFLTYELRNMAVDKAVDAANSDVARVKTLVSEALAPPIYVSNYILLDQRLKEMTNRQYESIYEVVVAYENYPTLQLYKQNYTEIADVRFYYNNETMLNNWSFVPITEDTKLTDWYQTAVSGKGLLNWSLIENEMKDNQKGLSLTRVIHSIEHGTFGVLVIDVNTNYLNWILSQETLPTMIVDSNNNIVAANRTDLINSNLEEDTFSTKLINEELGTFRDVIFDEPSYVIVENISVENSLNDLRIVSTITDAEIVQDANRLSRLGIIIISFSFFVALILIYSFSHLISKRLSILSNHIDKVAKGNLSTSLIVDGEDEIGKLSEQFNTMTVSIKELLEEVEEKNNEKRMLEKRQDEIKFKMLASQINPHFLFNTLETIRMRAHINGEKEIAHAVKKLGKLLRTSLEVGGGMIPLKQEIEMVTAYLEIQNFRFSERIEFELRIDQESKNCRIPPLSIQPLVENAVIHGLENKAEGGRIIVETSVIDNLILVRVIDNGVGIKNEKVKEISHSLKEERDRAENRIGLRNVHERLMLTYGKGLVIESEYLKGTCISFYIPVQK